MKKPRVMGSVEAWEKFHETGLFYFLKQLWRGFAMSSNWSKVVDCFLISLGIGITWHDGFSGFVYLLMIGIILTQSWVLTVTTKDLDTTTGAFLRVLDILNKERRERGEDELDGDSRS